MKTVKLPIAVVNQHQQNLGMDSPEEGEMLAYIAIDSIIVVRQAHDDKLGDVPMNTEATAIHLTSGDTFQIPLYIDDVLKLIEDAHR